MTIEEVQQARDALVQEGQRPSYNAVLARLGHGSKRDVARFLQELGAPEEPAELEAPDPYGLGAAAAHVTELQAALAAAIAEGHAARVAAENLAQRHLVYTHAVMTLSLIYRSDEREALMDREIHATHHRYQQAWETVDRVQWQLDQAQQVQQQASADEDRGWLQENHPALLAAWDQAQHTLQRTSDVAGRIIARQHLREVVDKVHQALATRAAAAD